MQGKLIYEFGPFRLDPLERSLSRYGQPLSLSPQLFGLLLLFVENASHLLSKDELRNKVWGQAHVSEDALKVIVGNLRKALGNGRNGPRWIENVRGGGYRFVAEVRKIEERSAPYHAKIDEWSSSGGNPDFRENIQPGQPKPPQALQSQPVRSAVHVRAWHVILGAISVALVGAFTYRPVPPLQLRVASYAPLTTDAREKSGPLFTDGARVYFAEIRPDGTRLAAVAVAGGGTSIIPLSVGHANAYAFDLSPHHSEFLAGRLTSDQERHELWVVPLGDSPKRIGDLKVDHANWSPDGRQIAFTLDKIVHVANANGSEDRKIAEITGTAVWPRWSPDGKTLRFTETSYRNGEVWQSLWQVAADGSGLHRFLGGWNTPPHECCGTWTPDGKFFIFQSMREGRTDLWAVSEKRSLFWKRLGGTFSLILRARIFSSRDKCRRKTGIRGRSREARRACTLRFQVAGLCTFLRRNLCDLGEFFKIWTLSSVY